MVILLLTGVAAWLFSACVSLVAAPLRLASGVVCLLVPRARSQPLRYAAGLKDGREYEFVCGGSRVRRTYFSDHDLARSSEAEVFSLARDEATGTLGIKCWQKRYPDGRPCGPGIGCWTNLDVFFGESSRGPLQRFKLQRGPSDPSPCRARAL